MINELRRLREPFLMPCRLTPGVKRALREYAQGTRRMISSYVMREKTEDEASFTMVVFPKAGCEPEETDPCKRYIAFATSLPREKALWNIHRLPNDYRTRWGIETGYAGVEEFRARTTSRNHTLRLLYFYYALILYNAWLLANLILAKRFSMLMVTEPAIRITIMKAATRAAIVASFAQSGEG